MGSSTDPDSSQLRAWIRDYYETVEFPEDDHFGAVSIYVRREDVS